MADLTELQRLAEGATPGPWAYDRGVIPPDGPGRYSTVSAEDGDLTIAEVNDLIPDGIANADYIAAMHPDTARKLIAVARAAEGALKALDALEHYEAPEGVIPSGREALRTALEELK